MDVWISKICENIYVNAQIFVNGTKMVKGKNKYFFCLKSISPPQNDFMMY